nr:acyltransferase [Enterovibrio nigricans]
MFFILSGFVMMLVYRDSFTSGFSFKAWRQFMWLRFSRIYPLFLVTIAVLVLWETFKYFNAILFYGGPLLEYWGLSGIPAFQGPYNVPQTLMSNLFLLQSLEASSALTWNFPAWSLSVEWLSYMLFPVIVCMVPHGAKRGVWLPILMLFVLYSMATTHGTIDLTSGPQSLLRALCGFTLGMWLSMVNLPTFVKRLANNDVVMFSIVAAMIYLLHAGASIQQGVIVYALFGLLVLFGANQEKRRSLFLDTFDNRATRFLGDISYSLYLWHAVVLLVGVEVVNYLAPEFLSWWYEQTAGYYLALSMVLFTAFLITLSTLTYRFIERPALKALRRVGKNKQVELDSNQVG